MAKTPNQNKAENRCKRIASEIKSEANGRLCRDCVFYQGLYCSYEWFDAHEIPSLLIYRSDAVACTRWELNLSHG
jgi:hypothetical protein